MHGSNEAGARRTWGRVSRRTRTRLSIALCVALFMPGAVLAQTAKEKELEARVAQLEKMVEQLMSRQQQVQTQVADTQAQVTEVRTAQAAMPKPAPEGKQPIQGTTVLTAANPGTAFSYGGFIKLDAMVTDTSDGKIADGSSGRLFYLPSAIPVGANSTPATDPYIDMHAQFSRFWFSADHVTDAGDKFKAYIEADLFGGGSNALVGNETATNTYALSLRQAYVSWNDWLAGQTWSNFQDVAALPDAVDFVGATDGTIFVRQAQLRYTKGPWSFSVENPQTTVTPYRGVGARFNTGDNVLPDFTARWLKKGDWGHFTVAALLRQFKYENVANGRDETESGAALSVSGKFVLGKDDDIRYALNGGSGIGRYLAFGLGSDTVQAADGSLEAIDGYGGYVAWRHMFSPKLRTNLFYSAAQFDNDKPLTGFGVTERAQSWHANVIYSPFPKLDIGAELIWGERQLEDDREGDLRRLHTHVKFSF